MLLDIVSAANRMLWVGIEGSKPRGCWTWNQLLLHSPRRRQPQTPDQASAHVRQNIPVQIRHDENLVRVRRRIRHDLQAGVVQQLGVELDGRKVLADLARGAEEQAVGHLHDGGLVHGAHLALARLLGVLEGEAQHPLRRLARDQLDRLHHAVDHHVLDARVLALGVLADQNRVDVRVRRLVPRDRFARPHVGEQVEGPTQGEVEGDVTFADGCL